MRFYVIFALLTLSFGGYSQSQTYEHINKTYDNNILSVSLLAPSATSYFPVISLGSGTLELKFDDLLNEERELYYKIIHCNQNWEKSDLRDLDFIDGFNEEPLRNFSYSVNTRIQYINYTLKLPNKVTNFRVSGNYILLIYADTPETPILTQRFIIKESVAAVNIDQVYTSDVENIRYKQEFTAEISPSGLKVRAPQEEFTLSMIRNEDWGTEVKSKPNFVLADKIRFTKLGVYQYWGLIEFRDFDTRSLNVIGRRVERINRNKSDYDVFLMPTSSLNENFYTTTFDFNGRFYIDNFDALSARPNTNKEQGVPLFSESQERDFNADYTNVHFSFTSKIDLFDDEEIYILGAFNNWQPSDESRMMWNGKMYIGTLLLKQGFYNYCYAIVSKDGKIRYHNLDGSWSETENDYHAIVYFRGISDLYDRVVGVTTYNTNSTVKRF